MASGPFQNKKKIENLTKVRNRNAAKIYAYVKLLF